MVNEAARALFSSSVSPDVGVGELSSRSVAVGVGAVAVEVGVALKG